MKFLWACFQVVICMKRSIDMRILGLLLLFFGSTIFMLCRCDKPVNDSPDEQSELALITLMHQQVLSPECAVSGCHDGHFEPDFRTLSSTFFTTVYHPVTKNNAESEFTYRVVPGDTAASVLHERLTNCCFINENDRMPQLEIGEPLPDSLIAHISRWILAGAPDILGKIAPEPDAE